jgi:UDP-N-acetylglucosamine 1-carboxyvinyltransferase
MDKFVIEGGRILKGKTRAGGSKNAALPILFTTILTDERMEFKRVPKLRDISTTTELLQCVGVEHEEKTDSHCFRAKKLTSTEAPYDLVRTMRASILILGPLLAREHKAKVSLPGGCAIGTRPVDIHLQGFEKMGANFRLEGGYIYADCPGGLKGAEIEFRFPSVGATENILMGAVLAEGSTKIINAAREPEIVDLARVLRAMGAKISGEGSEIITIEGVSRLRGCTYEIMVDRIEAGTLLLAGAMTGGEVEVEGACAEDLSAYLDLLKKVGLNLKVEKHSIRCGAVANPQPISFATEPYPGMPTDLQAQIMALLANIDGISEIRETIFENRFMHVPELIRMGANIEVQGNLARVLGKQNCYSGATVMATDLRASASLVLAGLAAKGTTHVRRIYHLDRGYEALEDKLSRLGAAISRVDE